MLQLSTQQLAFFKTFGFLQFPGLMKDRIDTIIAEFEGIFAANGGGHYGKPHDGKARSCVPRFIDNSTDLSSLIDDPRILGIATSLLGEDFNYMGSDGNYYTGDTTWHSDGWHSESLHIKLAFYLDKVSRDTGALRVIPGSHIITDEFALGCQNGVYELEKRWAIEGRDLPAYSLDSTPGDVVCFNHNLKHAAFGGSSQRRMFTINLCQRYPAEREQELRDYIAGGARFWVETPYAEPMLNSAGPQRRAHLEQVLANSDHLPELVRQARLTMSEPARG